LATRLVVGRIQKPKVKSMGINETLTEAGVGLGAFLTAIQNPVVNIVLALGIIGGILAIFYGIASVIRRAVGGATQSIGK
jgi:hypothetical protein